MAKKLTLGPRRNHELHIRVTRRELRQIIANAKASSAESLSQFSRRKLLARDARQAADSDSLPESPRGGRACRPSFRRPA